MLLRVVVRSLLALGLGLAAGACSGGGDDPAGAARAFFRGADCKTLTAMLDQSELSARIATGNDPTASLRETADFLEANRRRAPKVVVVDVGTLADEYDRLAGDAAKVNWAAISRGDPAATVPASGLGERLAAPRFSAAAFRLSTYAGRFCGA